MLFYLNTKQKIALARVLQSVVMTLRSVLGKGPLTEVTRAGIRWRLDLREGIDFAIWLLGSFEPETVRAYQRIIKKGDVVLDIGANIGAHTLLLAEAVGSEGRVIAFEPTDYAFSKLMQNCELNPQLRMQISCNQLMLVGSESKSRDTPGLYSSWPLKYDEALHGVHQGRLMPISGAAVRCLDSVVNSIGIDRVDCIKLDIDGHESDMLKGGSETLSRWHPSIVMELAPHVLQECGTTLQELTGILHSHGYRFYSVSDGSPLPDDPVALARLIPKGGSINVLAKFAV
ncbi:FkbM family methyltransferase [Methyloterricola oryzae]|uniref:FkbM family methyltransferase n=1 Tax=Methyloterricola oryzae TaxID=1495050 RepID=UPI00069C0A97|nr:FkbM family methyltransferase [Methyloterricola oryzae]